MMMACGHVVCQESLTRLGQGTGCVLLGKKKKKEKPIDSLSFSLGRQPGQVPLLSD